MIIPVNKTLCENISFSYLEQKESLQRKHNELYEKLTMAVKAHQDTQVRIQQHRYSCLAKKKDS